MPDALTIEASLSLQLIAGTGAMGRRALQGSLWNTSMICCRAKASDRSVTDKDSRQFIEAVQWLA
jgi:hypothetical protein